MPWMESKLMKQIILVLFCLISTKNYAHQTNLASFTLEQSAEGDYTIQLIGSLTGFETVINQNYSQIGFESVEEFKALVAKHFTQSLDLTINKQPVKFRPAVVTLGHQTSVIAELIDVDNEVVSMQLKNTFFKDILRNKMIVSFSVNDFPKKKYVLNTNNQHKLNLILKKDQSAGLAMHQ